MALTIYPVSAQHKGGFNNGAILENKPIQLSPDMSKLQPYSNIFYWAHAWSDNGSTIGMHPHKGFEILSFVLNGSIEHYDTMVQRWLPLEAGDVQIIRAGSGISHSEKINEGSDIFQIWFDPDLSQTLMKDASYDDYRDADFPVLEHDGLRTKVLAGEGSPLRMDTPGVRIRQISCPEGEHRLDLDTGSIRGIYVLDGSLFVDGRTMNKHDFALVQDETAFVFVTPGPAGIFIVDTPRRPDYKTYAQRYLQTA